MKIYDPYRMMKISLKQLRGDYALTALSLLGIGLVAFTLNACDCDDAPGGLSKPPAPPTDVQVTDIDGLALNDGDKESQRAEITVRTK